MHHDAKKTFRIGLIILLFLLVVSYAIYQSRKILEGPEIIIQNPKNGVTVYESLLLIEGSAKNINAISLNDRPIFIDEQGKFNEKLLLFPGYNIMKFWAKDKFDKEKILYLEINYQAPTPPPVPSPEATSTATSTTATSSNF